MVDDNMSVDSADDLATHIKNEVRKLKWLCVDDSKTENASSNQAPSLEAYLQKCDDNHKQLVETQHEIKHQVEELMVRMARVGSSDEPLVRTMQFEVTLRKADNCMLGLEVNKDRRRGDGSVVVDRIFDDGAVAAWNRQCTDRPIFVGDRIIGVNEFVAHAGFSSQQELLSECKRSRTLRLRIERDTTDWESMHTAAPSIPISYRSALPVLQAPPAPPAPPRRSLNKIPASMKQKHAGASTSNYFSYPTASRPSGRLRAEAEEFIPSLTPV
eukprot:GEMP01005802.1.p1 GENE.GEMP01005802.1~~GEMP01005802.1.p1  ORF type:complete len:271 (-),score=69.30 GEMP01005802.1:3104-3916(-)